MAESHRTARIDAQQLATPHGAGVERIIEPVAHAIERQPQHRPALAVFGTYGGNVRVMVLDADGRHAEFTGQPLRQPGAEEIGMQVMRNRLRPQFEHALQVIGRLLERLATGGVVQVADVLRQVGLRAARQAAGVLQKAAERQYRRAGRGQRDRRRRVAARATDEERRAIISRAHHAVVAADQDVAVVHDERIGDAAEPRHRLVVVDHQRLAARVGAGRHQQQRLRLPAPRTPGRSAGGLVKQQPVQRCGGQHHAKLGQPGRDARQTGVGTFGAWQQHDRCGRGFKQRGGRCLDAHHVAQRRDVGRHHRKRLFVALLAGAQQRHGLRLPRIADELEAAEALERDDAAGVQFVKRCGDRVAAVDAPTVRIGQPQARPAQRTGVRLRVEAAIARIVVLALARRALREARHAGLRPVIGQRGGDREARPAVGAVDERIAVTAVGRIGQLIEAGGTHGGIGCDAGADGAVAALDDAEAGRRHGIERRRLDLHHARQRRRLAAQPCDQRGDRGRRARRLDRHALAIVADAAVQMQLVRQPVDERPEAHALHQPAHADAARLARRHSGGGGSVERHRAEAARVSAAR